MIEGMKFHVKGEELKNLLAQRAEWHKKRAESLQVNLKQAQEGMEAATAAAVAAGRASGSTVYRSSSASLEVASAAYAAPRRNYGGSVEDPVEAIKQAIEHHTNRTAQLDFYSKHVVTDDTYVLNESDIGRYELIAPADFVA